MKSVDGDEDPFAIEMISLCAESRKLCVAGASSHVILFLYKKTETTEEVPVSLIEVNLIEYLGYSNINKHIDDTI